jgi:hypothetical protein
MRFGTVGNPPTAALDGMATWRGFDTTRLVLVSCAGATKAPVIGDFCGMKVSRSQPMPQARSDPG